MSITAIFSGSYGKPTKTSGKTPVATVDSNGKVTAKAAGTAYITASYGGKNAQCVVTVTAQRSVSINRGLYEKFSTSILRMSNEWFVFSVVCILCGGC